MDAAGKKESASEPGRGPRRKDRINIGPAVRVRRKELKLTLKDLAERSGLSVAFISQVERGKTAPSIISLLQISEALGVNVNYFVEATQEEKLIRRARDPEYIDVDSPTTYIRLSNSFPEQKIEPFIFILQPGYVSSSANIGEGHLGEGFLYVLNGRISGEYRGASFSLSEGDSMHYQLTSALMLNNPSAEEAKLLWVGSVVLFPTNG
ncbi:helix-turn-helix domain-containing protein [Sphingomonas crocodyli]|uniref:XRE family transcriptional regulator n=1 Tax=Sphingomonas crocodyli TaxID=1979270 RepID=A0A437M5Q3_9SPHN|nr:XRE family transcriptional regulator [Sphingomonas crocodyli]RVT92969.1 XRE family transcriptional regulator [Sphingomonas crocodyli]